MSKPEIDLDGALDTRLAALRSHDVDAWRVENGRRAIVASLTADVAAPRRVGEFSMLALVCAAHLLWAVGEVVALLQ